MFFGIRTAGKTIAFARAERIEVINNLVDGISEGANLTSQGKKMQTVVYEYLKAFLRAVAGFEFVPRNDFSVLTHIINSLPQPTQVLSFVYHGRDLTISTIQPSPEQVEQMVQSLEKKAEDAPGVRKGGVQLLHRPRPTVCGTNHSDCPQV